MYPHLKRIHGHDPLELRMLMEEEGREAIDRVLEEDQRTFEEENYRKLQELVESGAANETLEHVSKVVGNENDRHRHENIAHLDWVWRNIDPTQPGYRLRKLLRRLKRELLSSGGER